MSKDIKEYLHYYLGQQFMMTKPAYHAVHEFGLSSDTPFAMSGKFADYFHGDAVSAEVKPILRKLENMTEEEAINGGWSSLGHFKHYCQGNNGAFHPEDFHYLLSRGFWLFGDDWFDEGLIIDKETLKG